MMVGRRSFLFGPGPYFQGRTVISREYPPKIDIAPENDNLEVYFYFGAWSLFSGKLLEIQAYCMNGLSLLIIDPF